MTYRHVIFERWKIDARMSIFANPTGGDAECHVMLQVTDTHAPYEQQLQALSQALARIEEEYLPEGASAVFHRYFLSDPANQAASISHNGDAAISIIGQAPLNGTKIAFWGYYQTGVSVSRKPSGMVVANRRNYTQLWLGGATAPGLGSHMATNAMLGDYSLELSKERCTLVDNCVRTWFFVRDVDVNYAGVVSGRNEVFANEGLNADTHSIASTGIGGRNAEAASTVTLDALAVRGLQPGQMGYLHALTHLNPTYEYGVSFERATTLDFGDRRQVYISGTASINNRGEVVYPGDICRQTHRMWDNVEALLEEGDMTWGDISQIIVYLRDTADYAVVEDMFSHKFPKTPYVIVLAPVCRPGWLIEMECMGVKATENACYAPF